MKILVASISCSGLVFLSPRWCPPAFIVYLWRQTIATMKFSPYACVEISRGKLSLQRMTSWKLALLSLINNFVVYTKTFGWFLTKVMDKVLINLAVFNVWIILKVGFQRDACGWSGNWISFTFLRSSRPWVQGGFGAYDWLAISLAKLYREKWIEFSPNVNLDVFLCFNV